MNRATNSSVTKYYFATEEFVVALFISAIVLQAARTFETPPTVCSIQLQRRLGLLVQSKEVLIPCLHF